ncbi:hypothetical protein [Roseiflexus sp.]|uniref:hypothetical protein n=1 Tax=Roseiflexus sp. TaxID=2562120 RepID=UPI00398BB005
MQEVAPLGAAPVVEHRAWQVFGGRIAELARGAAMLVERRERIAHRLIVAGSWSAIGWACNPR